MARLEDKLDEIKDILIGIYVAGRGGGLPTGIPDLGVPSFLEAIEEDKRKAKLRRSRSKATGTSKKRGVTNYNKLYAKEFKKCMKKHKKKNGSWKKGGYARCVKEAHRNAKRR